MNRRPSHLHQQTPDNYSLPCYETDTCERKKSNRALHPGKRHKRSSLRKERFLILAVLACLVIAGTRNLLGGFPAARALLAPEVDMSEYIRAPRMVMCDLYEGIVTRLPPITNAYFEEGAYPDQLLDNQEMVNNDEEIWASSDDPDQLLDNQEMVNDDEEIWASSDDDDECVYRDWQTNTYTKCNGLHEISMFPEPDYFEFINCGDSRCTFRLRDMDGSYIVLKTQKFQISFNAEFFAYAKKDALIMERLTASPYVADIFASCGATQVVEYAEGGNIHDLIKLARLSGKDTTSSVDKLKICVQIAAAVADLHSFETDNIPSVSHNDICCHQFILADGVYKLNDFHVAKYMKQNTNTNQMCLARPPWIYQNQPRRESNKLDLPQEDTFMMADIMFNVLRKQWMYEGIKTKEEAIRLYAQGGRPEIPLDIAMSHDAATKAMVKAIQDCWIHDPKKRPSSRQVSDYLNEELRKIQGVEELGVVRVSIPPLPNNHRFTDSDFNNHYH